MSCRLSDCSREKMFVSSLYGVADSGDSSEKWNLLIRQEPIAVVMRLPRRAINNVTVVAMIEHGQLPGLS